MYSFDSGAPNFLTVCNGYIHFTLIMEKDFHDELCRRADFSLRLSEKMTSIDKDMAVIRSLKKLSGGSGFSRELFVNLKFDDLADLTLKLATQLNDVRGILKDSSAQTSNWGDDQVYKWKDSYINKDRTVAEREGRRILVTEQKEKIASEPTKRWVIQFGRVFAEGAFVSKS